MYTWVDQQKEWTVSSRSKTQLTHPDGSATHSLIHSFLCPNAGEAPTRYLHPKQYIYGFVALSTPHPKAPPGDSLNMRETAHNNTYEQTENARDGRPVPASLSK
jgi:hypothetical protein